MAGENGTNGAGYAPKVPSLDELKRAYEEGLPQTLLSGIEVYMRPVRPEKILATGKIPDILCPLMLGRLFPKPKLNPDAFTDEIGDFLAKPRDEAKEALEFVASVDVVCEAALIDPSIVPYLSLPDRMWIFKLAFMPVEVLSTFRLQPQGNVGLVDDEREQPLPAIDGDAGDSRVVAAEPADGVPV